MNEVTRVFPALHVNQFSDPISNIDFKKPYAPIFFVGGENDHIFPPNLTRTIAGRYKDANSKVSVKIFEGKSHFFCGEKLNLR